MTAPSPFPLFLQLHRQTVLVVGGGEAALRKVRLLLSSGCALVVVSPTLDVELEDLARTGRIQAERRDYRPNDLTGKALVFVTLESLDAASAVAAAARAAGLPVNAPDRPELSSFFMPAIVERAPITIAISTDGASPLLARKLRGQIEALLPANLGRFARFLGGVRQALKQGPRDFDARRRFLEKLLDDPIAERFLDGDEAGAERAAQAALRQDGWEGQARGAISLVTAPAEPDLLTLRDLRRLQEADVLVHDGAADPAILAQVRRDARHVFVGRSAARPALAAAEIDRLLLSETRAGHHVVHLVVEPAAEPLARRLAS